MIKSILITGGFGFLGGRFGKFFSSEYEIILASRFEKKIPDWLPFSKTYKINWENQVSLTQACNKVDVIIHASGLNAQDCAKDPEKAVLVNAKYTENLVKAAINQGVKKFIYLSTAHVYSDNLHGVINEDTPTTNSHPYAVSNIAGENAVLSASVKSVMKGIVVRIANAFGSPMDKNVNCWRLLANDLSKQAVINNSLTIFGDSSVVRDFVTIRNVCTAIEHLIKNDTPSIVNIGSRTSCSLKEMATKIQVNCTNLFGFRPPIIIKQKPSNNQIQLDYQSNYFDNINFKFVNHDKLEIKQLLNFCKVNFCKKNQKNYC